MREHGYAVTVTWTGDRGDGTASYRSYGRDHSIRAEGKRHAIDGSSDRTFHGDADRWNPEELVIAALAQCHMLSYLHVAADAGVVVTGYVDAASGTLETRADGSGALVEAVLRPVVTIAAGAPEVADALHARAAELCFIANSVAFPVRHEPRTVRAG
ncbi:MAG TPA: OsmC family protein [Microcella sp.]|nr:OsmC family protein [Microcella sp.]